MTMYEFNLLSEDEKVDLLYHEGTYLAKRKKHNLTLVLYQLEDFYVEVHYNKYRYLINDIRYFHSLELLNPYLEQIDIEEIMRYVE